MTIAHVVRAVYEDGWLKPVEPLLLPDRQRVRFWSLCLRSRNIAPIPASCNSSTKRPMSGWLSSQPPRCGNRGAFRRPRKAAWTPSSTS